MRQMGLWWSMLLAVSVVGPAAGAAPRGETITYSFEPGGLCISPSVAGCASYGFTVDAAGNGSFTGRNVKDGPATFHASAAEVRAFTARLRAFRAHGDVLLTRSPFCRSMVTDGATIDVRWQPRRGETGHLRFYTGCLFPDHDRMLAALDAAPRLLPIATLIDGH